jgi:hypothetical protein
MTVKDLIKALGEMEPDFVVHICIQGVPYVPVVAVKTEQDTDGGLVLLMTPDDHEINHL